MGKKIDLTGQKFGRWTVLGEAGRYKNGDILWNCRCKCGNKRIVSGYDLRKGLTKSCGCLKKERTKEIHTTHGMCNTPTYETWVSMMGRCNNPNDDNYSEYCRWATPTQQARNHRISKANKTGITGVCWSEERQKYCAQITANYKNIPLGRFVSLGDAVKARRQAEQRYWR